MCYMKILIYFNFFHIFNNLFYFFYFCCCFWATISSSSQQGNLYKYIYWQTGQNDGVGSLPSMNVIDLKLHIKQQSLRITWKLAEKIFHNWVKRKSQTKTDRRQEDAVSLGNIILSSKLQRKKTIYNNTKENQVSKNKFNQGGKRPELWKLYDTEEWNWRWHKQMERYIMLMGWENQYD